MIREIWAVRHGLRRDFEDEDWPNVSGRLHDPPLSKNGFKQAEETARYLEGQKIDHVFSSPFLRCIQTAHTIAQVIDRKVKIEHGFSEWMNPAWFEDTPSIIDFKQAKKTFSTIDHGYHSKIHARFPEHDEDTAVYNRVKDTFDQISELYEGSILVVAHGATLWQIERLFLNRQGKMNFRMCSINFLERENGNWHLKLATNKHLSISEDNIKFS